MKANFSSKSDNATAYIAISYRDENGKSKTKTIERLGTLKEIKEKYGCEDPRQWCKDYARRLTEEEKRGEEGSQPVEISIPRGALDGNKRAKLKAGDLFLLPLYRALGLDKVFDKIQMKSDSSVDLDSVMRMLIIEKVLNPDSNLNPSAWAEDNLIKNIVSEKDTCEGLKVLGEFLSEGMLLDIQSRIYRNSLSLLERSKSFNYYECQVLTAPQRLNNVCCYEPEEIESILESGDFSTLNQIQLGMLVDNDGIPVVYMPIPYGHDSQKSVDQLVSALESKFGIKAGDDQDHNIVGDTEAVSVTESVKYSEVQSELDWFFNNLLEYLRLKPSVLTPDKRGELYCLVCFVALTLAKLLQRIMALKGLCLESLIENLNEIEYYHNEQAGYVALFQMNEFVLRLEQIYPNLPFAYHLVTFSQMNKMYRCRDINLEVNIIG